MKKDITNRDDVKLLVVAFYDKIRTDDVLSPIFNRMIPDECWQEHLEKLTDFWETNLFGVAKFKGSPTQKHVKTDRAFEYTLGKAHFDRWLDLWKCTLDTLFYGDKATRAKMAAYRIAEIQHLILERNKPKLL